MKMHKLLIQRNGKRQKRYFRQFEVHAGYTDLEFLRVLGHGMREITL